MFTWHYSVHFFHRITFTKVGGPCKFSKRGVFPLYTDFQKPSGCNLPFWLKPLTMNTAKMRIFLKVFLFPLPGSVLPNNWHPQ